MKFRRTAFVVLCLFIIFAIMGCGGDTPLTALTAEPPLVLTPRGTVIPVQAVTPLPVATQGALPPCVPTVAAPVALPASMPTFPFPQGTRIYKAVLRNNSPNYMQIGAYVPLDLSYALGYLIDHLPQNGMDVTFVESENTEGEGTFEGDGWRGSFRILEVPSCPHAPGCSLMDLGCVGATAWTIVLAKGQ